MLRAGTSGTRKQRASGATPAAMSAAALLAILLVAALTASPALANKGKGTGNGKGGRASDPRPNIIVVVTDDQSSAAFNPRTLPKTYRKLARRGVNFPNQILSTPLCCPYRASLLTGQYGHNNGVLDNGPGYTELQDPGNVLPRWLKRAGYRTAHFGRFLNGYDSDVGIGVPPPGWSYWHGTAQHLYYGYQEAIGMKARRRGRGNPRNHITLRINRLAKRWVRDRIEGRRPLYVQVDQLAPHFEFQGRTEGDCEARAIPAPSDEDLLGEAPALPEGPGYDEADVSDKPSFIQALPPLDGAGGDRELARAHACEFAALRAVDRGVAELIGQVRKAGELRNTFFAFTTDNGLGRGEHRLPTVKALPYEEITRVPLLTRPTKELARAGKRGREVTGLVAGIDLAATIVDLAEAESCVGSGCRTLDGRSLLPLIAGTDDGRPADRAIPLELDRKGPTGVGNCDYQGVRTRTAMYVEHTALEDPELGICKPTSELEYYDLEADPFQLDNLAAPAFLGPGGVPADLIDRAERLADCAGIEGRDPKPESGVWCE